MATMDRPASTASPFSAQSSISHSSMQATPAPGVSASQMSMRSRPPSSARSQPSPQRQESRTSIGSGRPASSARSQPSPYRQESRTSVVSDKSASRATSALASRPQSGSGRSSAAQHSQSRAVVDGTVSGTSSAAQDTRAKPTFASKDVEATHDVDDEGRQSSARSARSSHVS